MKCLHCGDDLRWNNDFDTEDDDQYGHYLRQLQRLQAWQKLDERQGHTVTCDTDRRRGRQDFKGANGYFDREATLALMRGTKISVEILRVRTFFDEIVETRMFPLRSGLI